MPYNEFRQQAEQYYNIAVRNLEDGNRMTALSHLQLAKAIAIKNSLYDLVRKIDALMDQIS